MSREIAVVVLCLGVASMALATEPGAAPKQSVTAAELKGLWVGTVSHDGETSPFALELEPGEDGKALVKVSIPAIHLHQVPLGRLPLEIEGDQVRAGSFVLTHDRAAGTLGGTIPESLAPVYKLPVTLRRANAFEPPPRPRPTAPVVKPVWTYDAGAPLWAGTSAADGLVLAGADDGQMHALEARTGARRWVFRAGGAIRTRTTVVNGTAIFQADDGVLYALSVPTGQELWRVRVVAAPVVRKPSGDPTSRYDRYGSDVTAVEDHLFLGTHEGRALCLDARTGAGVWEFKSGDAVLAAPAVAGGRVVFGSFDGHVYALDATTGRLLWKRDTGKPVVSTPAVAGDRVVVGSRSYDLLALDVASGAVAWQRYFWFSWVESSAVVRDGVVYVGSSDAAAVYAFEVATGRQVWKSDVWGWAWDQPAVTATRVYIGTAGQKGYPVPHRGAVMALDRATGQAVWQLTVEPKDDATFGFTGSPAVAAGLVFVAGLDGRVVAFSE
jgi:outer membrane protein assembly factor BamB